MEAFFDNLLFMFRAQLLLAELINREENARGISVIVPSSDAYKEDSQTEQV